MHMHLYTNEGDVWTRMRAWAAWYAQGDAMHRVYEGVLGPFGLCPDGVQCLLPTAEFEQRV